ncbi:MAG: NADH-quinone oxidoreductase subunit L [Candidatus Methylomirabilales bacterium]
MMHLIWLVPGFPLVGVIINGLFGRSHIRDRAHWVAVPAVGLSFLVALLIALQVFAGQTLDLDLYPWLVAGNFQVPVGFLVDPLSTVMMLTVTFVGLLIHVYSVRYMQGDPGYPRYFTYLNLFMFAMLILVLANNYLLMFLGWEGVGVCSYLLIGFWYERKNASDAANKAFIVNRVGDAGFLLGLFLIWTTFGSLKYAEVFARAEQVLGAGSTLATVITLALFVGAMGKSAQLPLSVWLPDAMEGPTPTSAMIHAATMVTAGVYMVVRSSPLFNLAPDTANLVAVVGALTAIFAASIGCVQNSIKQTLAYSTISQLGFMFLAAGLGAYATAIFHLFTHAFFKSLLFLGAGSVIQSLHGEHDVRRMGGLAPHMRLTAYAFLIGALATAGVFPLAGFWSQRGIFLAAFNSGRYFLWVLALFAAFLIAFYMFRLYLLTFAGHYRGDTHAIHHLRKAPTNLWVPLVILAFLAVAAGFVGVTPEHGGLHNFLGQGLTQGIRGGNAPLPAIMLLLPLGVAAAGIGLAYLSYLQWWELPFRSSTLYVVLFRRYFLDEIYSAIFLVGFRRVCHLLWRMDGRLIDGTVNQVVSFVVGAARASSRIDERVIDGAVNQIASLVGGTGRVSSRIDERVIDGAVNQVAHFVAGTAMASARIDERVIDGAVNQVAHFVAGTAMASARIDERVIDGAVNQVAHFVGGTAMASTEVDEEVVDARVDWVAELNQTVSDIMRRLQTGLIQNYLLAMALGIFLVACLYIIFR